MKEMVGGCCVCSDERGWPENPLVYCDGQGCTVAVHQACYGIVTVPIGPWYCRKCESQERAARVRCDLCPSRDGALKKTDSPGGGWAHVVCALYIPEVRFGNVTTMEPIILQLIPQERYNKTCYICQENGKGSRASMGACMQCNKSGCKQQFHVTCAQQLGLLCEEAGNYLDNVKYCGYCQYHYSKLKKGGNVKPIPPYKPISHDAHSSDAPSSPEKESDKGKSTDPQLNNAKQRKSSSTSKMSSSTLGGSQMGASGQSSSVLSTTTGGLLSTNSLVNPTFGGGSGGGSNSAGTSGAGKSSTSSSTSSKDTKESKHKGASKSTTKGHDKEQPPPSISSRSYKLKNKEYDPSQSNTSSGTSHKNEPKDQVPMKTNSIVQPARLTAVSPSLGLAPSSLGGLKQQQDSKLDQKGGIDVFAPKFTTSNFTEIMVNEQSSSSSGSGGGKKRKSDGRLSSGTIVDDSNKDLIRDVSVTLVPLQGYDKLDSSDAEKSIKKFCISQPKSESLPAITTATSTVVAAPVDVNLQNLSPNIVSSKQQQVIQQNVQSSSVTSQQQQQNTNNSSGGGGGGGSSSSNSSSSSSKSVTSQPQHQLQTTTQSLVVSVPLSTANVPGVNLNLAQNNNNNNNNNISNNNNLASSGGQNVNPFMRNEQLSSQNRQSPAIVNHHNQMLDRESVHRIASPAVLISPIDHGGGMMHTATMAEIQGGSTMLKITYEKQNRVTTLQEERAARRSRSRSIESGPSSNGFRNGSNNNVTDGVGGGAVGVGSASGSSGSGGTNSTKTKGGRSSKNKRSAPSNEPLTATDLSQSSTSFADTSASQHHHHLNQHVVDASASTAAPTKIRRTPTSNIEQSPPHSISRTPEVIYSSSSSSTGGGGGSGGGGGNFGGLKFGYEAQTPAPSSSLTNQLQIIATQTTIKDSPQSSPGSEGGNSKKRIKKQHTSTSSTSASTPTDNSGGSGSNSSKLFQNGISHAAHMLGNTLNPSSSMAAKMTDTLNQEIEAHMANTVPEAVQHVGPMYPGKIQANRPSALSTHGSQSLSSMLTGNPTIAGSTPQSLEQLLERQWEQGSQFLMEQAQHFDIASLLSCLHQLKSENVRLEEHVTSLVARRDHLLAVNARLAIPLNPPAGNQGVISISGHYNNMHSTTNGPVQSENAANAAAAAVNSASNSGSNIVNSRRGSSQVTSQQQSSYNAHAQQQQQPQQQQQQLPLENGIDFRHSSNSGVPPPVHSQQMRHSSSSSSQSYSSNSRQSSSSGGRGSAAAAFITQQQVYSTHQSMRRDDSSVKPS